MGDGVIDQVSEQESEVQRAAEDGGEWFQGHVGTGQRQLIEHVADEGVQGMSSRVTSAHTQ